MLAPGQDIESTKFYDTSDNNIEEDDKYLIDSGTSFAAPHVTGVAALVQQAFPYLEGKRIGDVLLSTAQKLTVANGKVPPFILLYDKSIGKIIAYTYKENADKENFFKDQLTDIEKYLDEYFEFLPYDVNDLIGFKNAVQMALSKENLKILTTEQYEGLFGQGIVNAGLAVRGPGKLDAYRLEQSDLKIVEVGDIIELAWMYSVDTDGYTGDSVWRNNISQIGRPAPEGGDLSELSVGLEKLGLGVLALSGTNTYKGPTLVKEGDLRLENAYLSGRLKVAQGASLLGHGSVDGATVIDGKVDPSGDTASDYGKLTFHNGLILSNSAEIHFDLGIGTVAGKDYDSITVSGGALSLGGILYIDNQYTYEGTYILFNYKGASYNYYGNIDNNFSTINYNFYEHKFNSVMLYNDISNQFISLILSNENSNSYVWQGIGEKATWYYDFEGLIERFGNNAFDFNANNNEIEFIGKGEEILFTSFIPYDFDVTPKVNSLSFLTDGFIINPHYPSTTHHELNYALQVDTEKHPATINVADGITATINIEFDRRINSNYDLIKTGGGTLILGGSFKPSLNGNNNFVISEGTVKVDGYMNLFQSMYLNPETTFILQTYAYVNNLNGSGSVILNSDILIINPLDTSTPFSGIISGPGKLNFIYDNDYDYYFSLIGNNSYSGINIFQPSYVDSNGSFIVVGNTDSLKGDIVLESKASTIIFDQPFDGTFSGTIYGSGKFIKDSAGVLSISSANATDYYSLGANEMIIRGGSLLLDSANIVMPEDGYRLSTIVFEGATLGGNGKIGNAEINGTLSPGGLASSEYGELIAYRLFLNDTSTLAMDLGNGNVRGVDYDTITLWAAGDLELAGTLYVSAESAGTYTLFDYSSSKINVDFHTMIFEIGGVSANGTLITDDINHIITLILEDTNNGTNQNSYVWNGIGEPSTWYYDSEGPIERLGNIPYDFNANNNSITFTGQGEEIFFTHHDSANYDLVTAKVNSLSFVADGFILSPTAYHNHPLQIDTANRPATINVSDGITATINLEFNRGTNSNYDLIKTGGGTLILGGWMYNADENENNNFVITEGTVKIRNDMFLNQNVYLNSGTTIEFESFTNINNLSGAGSVIFKDDIRIANPLDNSVPFSGNIIGQGKIEFIYGNDFDYYFTMTGSNSYGGFSIGSWGGGDTNGSFTVIGNSNSLKGEIDLTSVASTVIFDQNFDGIFSGNIKGKGTFIKDSAGELIISGGDGTVFNTIVRGGSLLLDSTNITLNVRVLEGATLAGNGSLGNNVEVYGTLSPAGHTFNEYGEIVSNYLSLYETSTLAFDLGNGNVRGVDYDTITLISGGEAILAGTLLVSAVSAGTYTLFDYVLGSINLDFNNMIFEINGVSANGTLTNDIDLKQINLTLDPINGTINPKIRKWLGTGSSYDWTGDAGQWEDGSGWTNQPGNVLTFAGTGDTITLSGLAKDFDTLKFTGDNYHLKGGLLKISPEVDENGVGEINVASQVKAVIDSIIFGTGKSLLKTGYGRLVLGGANTYTGGTTISEGSLFLSRGASLAEGQVTVEDRASLDGFGTVNGPVEVRGRITVAGFLNSDYGVLTFKNGLVLSDTAAVYFDMGNVGVAGTDYDSIRVSGGTLVLGGGLSANVESAGTYTLFNYSGANYAPERDIAEEFVGVTVFLNGASVIGILANDDVSRLITLTVGENAQFDRYWTGTGYDDDWSDSVGSWTDGPVWINRPGTLLTFYGDGDTITLKGSVKDFDTLHFTGDDFAFRSGTLRISPYVGGSGAGVINVDSGVTATVDTPIDGAGKSLSKVGYGTLVLGGVSTYSGETTVSGGTLVLDRGASLASGLTVEAGTAFAGSGTVGGHATVRGTVSAGGPGKEDFGLLTFVNGLTLTDTAQILFDLGNEGLPGEHYDSVTVSGGYLELDGSLFVYADSAGTYTLFNYSGASYESDEDINKEFLNKYFSLNGEFVNGILKNNSAMSTITLYISADNQLIRQWTGTGSSADWTDESGKWDDWPTWTNQPGNVLTFAGSGDRISLKGSTKDFDTLQFSGAGFALQGGSLRIIPGTDGSMVGVINVASGVTATVDSDITGPGKSLSKVGDGTLILGGINTYYGGTTISSGSLVLSRGASLASGKVNVEDLALLEGYGTVGGPVEVRGTVNVGRVLDSDYGMLTFQNGLVLTGLASVNFDLGNVGLAGTDYDSITVSGGTLVLGGFLNSRVQSAGTYTLFNYSGASYVPDKSIDEEFQEVYVTLNGATVIGVLANDDVNRLITLTVGANAQFTRRWAGFGNSVDWSDSSGKWIDGPIWINRSGTVLTFINKGDTVTLKDSVKEFDTLLFTGDGYTLRSGTLKISPYAEGTGIGMINVYGGVTATVNTPIEGAGKQLDKVGQGTLVLGGANTYTGGTLVSGGTLLLDDGVLASGQLLVKGAGTLAGNGEVGGPAIVQGKISVGVRDGDYGMLTFLDGLTLAGTASVIFDLGHAGVAGEDYDSITVAGGSLYLAGKLMAYAASAGTYTLFDYDGATFQGDITSAFKEIYADLNGVVANATLKNDDSAKLITLTMSLGNQTATVHEGNGQGAALQLSGNTDSGQVITFVGTGETVSVTGGAQTHFDTLTFTSDGYVLTGDGLEINPDSGNSGAINVHGADTATTVENVISGSGQSLRKEGDGTLVLAGDNDYDGGTTVAGGTLRGNIVSGTDLTVLTGAVYDGDGEARSVKDLNGDGIVSNTDVLTVSGGIFGGVIDDTNVGGLVKTGDDELYLAGTQSAYAGGTTVAGGTLKGNIASGTDLTVEIDAVYDGDWEARSVGKLNGGGTIQNTHVLTVSGGVFAGDIDHTNSGGLVKTGEEELYLTGSDNLYSGGTFVKEGTLRGNIADGTDLDISDGAVYDGDGVARRILELTGSGSIVNTDVLTVTYGDFDGVIDGSNTGGLRKIGEGDLFLTGENSYDGGTKIVGGRLFGSSLSLRGDIEIANDAVLGFIQDEDDTFDGSIYGAGDIFKYGYGSLVFDGLQVAGQFGIIEGGLIVGGTSSQNAARMEAAVVNVYEYALLGGHGTIGSDVVVHAGGRLSPGNSYGTTAIDGDLTFEKGGIFEVEVNPFNAAEGDMATVSGTAVLTGGIVLHHAADGTAEDFLKTGNKWRILDAESLIGTFAGAVSDLAFLLPQLDYDRLGADVFMSFRRVGNFEEYGNTRNSRSVAAALESLDISSSLYQEIVGWATPDQVPGLLDDLSGEMHGAVTSGLFGLGLGFSNMLSSHVAGLSRFGSGYQAPAAGSPGEGGNSFWAVAGGTHTVLRGTADTARTTMVGPEISVGYDHSFDNGWLAGLAFQYGHKKLKTAARHSEAEVDSLTIGVYGGREIPLGPGSLRLLLSGTYSHHDIDSTRRVAIGGQTQTLEASYAASSLAGSLEAAYRFPVSDSFHLEPYVSIGVQRLRLGGFSETGGSAALTSVARSWNHAVSAAGLRLLLAANDRVSFAANLGWQHTFGNVEPTATYAFREGGRGFTVSGSPMNRNEALVGLDLGVKVSDNVRLSLGYNGAIGNRGQSHGGMAMVEVKW